MKASTGGPAARRLLVFLLTLGLVWAALQFLVWPRLAPAYARAVAAAADLALGPLEAGRRVTRIQAEGILVHLRSDLSLVNEISATYSAEVLHGYAAIVVSLIAVFPGLPLRRRLAVLAAAAAGLYIFHVAVLLILVETLYAVQLTPFSAQHYSETERELWLGLRATVLYFAMTFVPAAVLAVLFVARSAGLGRHDDAPRARPRLPRVAAVGIGLVAAAVVVLALVWAHHGKVRARQAEKEARLGYVAIQSGAAAEADGLFVSAVTRDPLLAKAHDGLGLARMKQGRLEEAAASFRTAIERAPNEAPPHLHLGNALATLGDLEGAIPEFRRAAEIQPTSKGIWMNLAMTAKRLGRAEELEPALRKVLEIDPGDAVALKEMTSLLAATGRECEALVWLERPGAEAAAPLAAELRAQCGGTGTAIRPRP